MAIFPRFSVSYHRLSVRLQTAVRRFLLICINTHKTVTHSWRVSTPTRVVYTRPKIRRLGCEKPGVSLPSKGIVAIRSETAAAWGVKA